ncbi:hypothetical protein MXB_4408 [Myxobolus squamalis]|nr:hypothetical protein MXB_4408 [Myxobolus squamalis]
MEKATGRIKRQNRIKFLLLKANFGIFHWTPPKGHIESEETEMMAAWRELQEETGLRKEDVKLYSQFREELNYETANGPKQSVYFLAQLKNYDKQIKISNEHLEYRWVECDEGFDGFIHDDTVKLLVKALLYIIRR